MCLSDFYNVHWVTGLWSITEEIKCIHRVGDMRQGHHAFAHPAASSCDTVFIQLNVWHRVRSAFMVCATERPGLDSVFPGTVCRSPRTFPMAPRTACIQEALSRSRHGVPATPLTPGRLQLGPLPGHSLVRC